MALLGPRSRTVLLVVFVTVAASPADAQTCAGRTSFNLAPTHFGLDAGTNGSGRGFGASLGSGTDALFGILSGATHAVTGAGSVEGLAVTLATDQPLSPDNKLHVCPMITVGYMSDSNGTTGHGRIGASAAADASMLTMNTPRLRVMPTIGIDLRFNGVGRTIGLFAQDASRNDSTFSAGIGLVIWNRLSLVPRLIVPFDAVTESGFQMTVGYNLLRR
jgi:hypothetical protein